MKKILKTLLGIALSASASFGISGCGADYNYGAKSTLYLMGPHGEPAPVVISENVPQPRRMRFQVYNTNKGEMLVLEDYGSEARKQKPSCYKMVYAKYPNGKKGIAVFPVEISVYSKNPAESQTASLKDVSETSETPANTSLEKRLESKTEALLEKTSKIADATIEALSGFRNVLEETQKGIMSIADNIQESQTQH